MTKRQYTKGYKQPKEWLTKEEYNRLINHPYIPTKDDLIIQMLYGCALRVSELSNIRVRDIDIDNGTICIWETKRSNDPALVPIPAPVLKMLNQWITDNNLTKIRYLFFSSHSKKLSRTQIHRIVKEAAERADIKKKLTCHSFRSYVANQIMSRNNKPHARLFSITLYNEQLNTRHNPGSISRHN